GPLPVSHCTLGLRLTSPEEILLTSARSRFKSLDDKQRQRTMNRCARRRGVFRARLASSAAVSQVRAPFFSWNFCYAQTLENHRRFCPAWAGNRRGSLCP